MTATTTTRWLRIAAGVAPVVLLAGVLSASPVAASSAVGAGRPRPVVGTTEHGIRNDDGVLSPRLSDLTTPSMRSSSPAERSTGVGLPASGAGSLLSTDHGLVVMIGVTDPSEATQRALTVAGATIGAIDPSGGRIEASVSVDRLVAVGSVSGVRSVHEELTPRIAGQATATAPSRAETVTAAPACNPVVTEGDAQLRATTARATYGLDGAGVKVGILSDSYNRNGGAADGVASGNLPGPGNPCGHTTPVQVLQEDTALFYHEEGRAMAEVVHDVAPEATLLFASAANGEWAFATNIRSLAAAGAKVIVDDVEYEDEPMYQDGDVAKAIADVTALGVTYYSAAGNENILDLQGRDVSSYETDAYRPTTCPVLLDLDLPSMGYDCHDFDPGGGVSNSDPFTLEANERLFLDLDWNEPQYGIVTDLDLFVVDTFTNSIASRFSWGKQDNDRQYQAFEGLFVQNPWLTAPHDFKIVVARYKNPTFHPGGATPRFKVISFGNWWSLDSVQFPTSAAGDVIGPSVFGHNASFAGASVGAVPFDDATTPEPYSSRGPATYCWAPTTGTTTPAAALPSCQTKPLDFMATDGGLTSFFNDPVGGPFWRFWGTSAAAPHAAAIGALMIDARPCATPAQILTAQRSTARHVGSFGVGAAGSGLLDANAAVGALPTCPVAAGARYHPVAPTRILESRAVGNIGTTPTKWGPGESRSVDVTDTGGSGVPDTGVSAVVLNVTVTGTTAPSFLTVYPDGDPVPTASNLNWPASTTIANLVTVKVGAGGKVDFYNQNGTTDVIADVVGWYDTDAGAPGDDGVLYTPTTPTRILESRNIVGNTGGYTTPWNAGQTRTVDVVGASQHPVPAGATAVVLNVTAVGPSVGGFLTVFPADVSVVPTASNINWNPGQTIPNLVTVKLPVGDPATAGKIKVFNDVGAVDVVADVVGYYGPSGSAFHALAPTRILESRFANGNLQGQWSAGQTRSLDVTDTHGSGVPAGSVAKAVVMNVTVTGTDDAGFLTLFPAGLGSPPNASNLNWSRGDTIPNLTITKVDPAPGDNVKIFNQRGNAYVIADVVGWFG